MKLVKKALRSTRKFQIRSKGRSERGKITNTFASFFDAVPTAASSDAFVTGAVDIMGAVAPEKSFVAGDGAPVFGSDVDVETVSPDAAALENKLRQVEGRAFGLWLTTKTAPDTFERIAPHLAGCAALHIVLPDIQARGKSSQAVQITEGLIGAGFEPVLRSAADSTGTFHLLLVHSTRMGEVLPKLTPMIDTATDPAGKKLPIKNADIPVFIPCFNNQTYCRTMVDQLRAHGFVDITLIDNSSTSPDMHAFLDEIEAVVNVDRLKDNLGPKKSVFTPERYVQMPRYFCVTDPDIVFNRFLPDDFIAQLIDITQQYQVGKAGFALNIMHRQFFKEAIVKLFYQDWKIWEWEETLWKTPIGKTRSNDTVFDAGVDTTFALYDKEQWDRSDFLKAVRVGGRFTAIHAPWYEDSDVPQSERDAYTSESVYSYYKM